MTANVQKLIAEKIHLIDVKIALGRINSHFDKQTDVEIGKFDFGTELSLGFNIEEKNARAVLDIKVKGFPEDSQEILAESEFELHFYYHIENLDELYTINEDQKMVMDAGLGNALASITYSTTRGILMTRFQGTSLQDFIMPVINPNTLIKQ